MKDNMIRNTIILSVVLIGLAIGIGFSFAFFTAGIEGNNTAENIGITAGTIELTFADNDTFNFDKAQPGDYKEKTFTVQNTGTLKDNYSYNIKLTDLNVTFQKEDLVYILQEYTDENYNELKPDGINNTGFINQETINENGEMYLATKIERPTNTGDKHYYKLTIKFENLEDINQKYNFGAKFSGKVNVDDSKDAKVYKKAYTITTSITNGTVEPAEMEVMPEQDSEVFTIKPDTGYRVESITCDNDQVVEQTDNTFIVKNVTNDSNCTVKTTNKNKITAHVVANGSVSPGEQEVTMNHDSEEFTITPNDGYKVDKVECTNEQQVSITGNIFKVTKVTSDSDCTITLKEKPQSLFDYCSTNEQLSTCIPKAIELDNLEEDDTKDKNIRYVGATPNNYIWFNCGNYSLVTDAETAASQNCEKWRIIGYMNDKKLVKIIRAESVGSMKWDSTQSNNWNRPADLRTPLINYYNGTKLSDAKGITSATRSMISSVTWNLGGHNTNSATAQTLYNAERGNTGGAASPAATTWNGYIGLMYPSDYGYAADKSCWSTNLGSYNNSSYGSCMNSDWLFNSTVQWTLTPLSDRYAYVFLVSSNGNVSTSNGNSSYAVRPSLYLKSSVKIKSGAGNGSSETPYIIVP